MPERTVAHVLQGYLDTRCGSVETARDAVLVRSEESPPEVLRVWRWRDIDLCLIQAGKVQVVPHRWAPVPDELVHRAGVIVGYVVDGAVCITQDRRTIEVGRGQVVLYDGITPCSLRAEVPHRYLIARIGGQVMPLRAQERAVLVVRDLSPFAGAAALSSLLAVLVDVGDDLAPAAGGHLGDAIVSCLQAIIAEVRGAAVGQRSAVLFGQLTGWIDAHLLDEDLTTELVAAEHFLSPRYVRKLFADHEVTVSGYVRTKRLERVRDELSRPWNAHLPIAALAARWGFHNPSVFSRCFARRFGLGPQEFRRAVAGATGQGASDA
nr:helix-turn-helix domain-containing protein [Kineococcus vitellinus]